MFRNNFGMNMFDDEEERRPGESGFTASLRKSHDSDAFFQQLQNDPPPPYEPRMMRESNMLNRLKPGPYGEEISKVGIPSLSSATAPSSAMKAEPVSQALKLGSGFVGSPWMAAAHVAGSGLNAVSNYFQSRERNALSRESRDKEYAAAERVGLSHPSQFNSISGNLGKFKGNQISPIQRTFGTSPYSF